MTDNSLTDTSHFYDDLEYEVQTRDHGDEVEVVAFTPLGSDTKYFPIVLNDWLAADAVLESVWTDTLESGIIQRLYGLYRTEDDGCVRVITDFGRDSIQVMPTDDLPTTVVDEADYDTVLWSAHWEDTSVEYTEDGLIPEGDDDYDFSMVSDETLEKLKNPSEKGVAGGHDNAADALSEMTGEDREQFEYDGDVPEYIGEDEP